MLSFLACCMKLEEKQLQFALERRISWAGTALRRHSLRLTGRGASPYCTVVCGTVPLNLCDPSPSTTGSQKGLGTELSNACCMLTTFLSAWLLSPYPEPLNFPVLMREFVQGMQTHCVTGTWDVQKQVSWGSANGWVSLCKITPSNRYLYISRPIRKPSPPYLVDLDK